LDLRAGTPGTPIDIQYDTTWPEDVPELRTGETLVKPKSGLPQIDGQTSVEILYQQSMPQNSQSERALIDPVRLRTVALTRPVAPRHRNAEPRGHSLLRRAAASLGRTHQL
jgi:hypothetical protein